MEIWCLPAPTVDKPEHFEILGTHAVFRPLGEVSLEQGVRLVTSAITYAREQKVRRLLVVATAPTGFKSPTVTERYYMAKKFAQAARSMVRVAVVASPEVFDSQRFGELVAKNSGLALQRFASEEEALAWLLSNG